MSLVLGCIADDYTGASDLANTLTRNGLRTVQTIGIPTDDLALPAVDAIVVALKIRSVAADAAVEAARAADRWLRGRGAKHCLYKICSTFDSTDAGNIGPVTEALSADAGAGTVMVTPAFPATGRSVYMGHLFVGGVLLNESPLKDHPLNPMHDASLVRVLGRQMRKPVGLVDLATIGRGAQAIRERLTGLQATGHAAVIIDAVFDRDLEVIGEVAAEVPVSIGASGLGLGLARALTRSGRVKAEAATADDRPVGGLVAALAGSCSKATLEQVATASQWMPVLRLETAELVRGEGVEAALGWAADKIGQGPVLIASSDTPEAVAALQARFGREAAGHAIEQAMAAIAEGLVAQGVRRLVVAGGETSGAVVDRLKVPAFLVGPEIAPGVPVLRAAGQNRQMLLTLKSGNFGGPDFFRDAFAQMS